MRVIVDIGGTNARFATLDGTTPGQIRKVAVRDYPDFPDALRAYVSTSTVASVAIAAAGPVIDGAVSLTNASWRIAPETIQPVVPRARIRVLNDLAAVALAVPHLTDRDRETLHAGKPTTGPEPILCANIGTGFGAAVAIPHGDVWHALPTEAGHMGLAPQGDDKTIFDCPTTVERILSGPGLQRMRAACRDSAQVRSVFSDVFGRVAGDLILATGAWGGLYLCGGVLHDLDAAIDRDRFLAALHRRTGVATRVASVPVHHILVPEPAFLGLAHL